MKQRRIKELTINHYEQGGSVQYTPSRTEEYAPVLAQAEAHQDLRFHAEINSTEVIVILPWETVISVNATYETAEVPAPTDAICGGEPTNPLVLKLIEPSESCYGATDGVITAFVSTYDGDFRASQHSGDTLNDAFIKQVMLDGVDITEDDDFWENVEATYEMTLANGVATFTITISYQGYTASQSLTASEVCSNIGG